MLKRTITGAVYVAIIVGFFFLRDYVDYRLFNILIFAFCAAGTFEIARALKPYLFKGNFVLSVIYGGVFVPLFCVFEYITAFGGAYACLIFAGAAVLYQLCFSALKAKNAAAGENKRFFKVFCVNSLAFVYPALLLLTLLLANGLENGFLCLVLTFVIPPCADTFAYLVGMTYNKIRKGKAKKMCPNLSPKKTWAGAIGGVFGGVIGAMAVYFIAGANSGLAGAAISPLIIFMLIGFVASILTETGDLFESFIKRKVGIKDMGKILPGHGGVMDRIDGTVFAAAFIYLVFSLLWV